VFCDRIPSHSELIAHYNTYPRHDSISRITLKRYEEILNGFRSYKKLNRVIDVGCGNGHLLAVAKKLGWEVFGTEFTDQAVQLCEEKGIQMHKGVLDIKNYKPNSFDCLFFVEVIEHINNPLEELAKFHTLLRPGGVLYITTPNFISYASRTLKSKWTCVEYPEHLTYYTPSTLNKILVKSGFKKISLNTTGLSYSSFKPREEFKSTSNNGNETIREKTENNFVFSMIKKIVNTGLSATQLGETIKAIYIKK
jgi:SAM-dependent methyltransferase